MAKAKKPAAKKPAAATKPAAKKPAKPAATVSGGATVDLAALKVLGDASSPEPWEHANAPLLVGLERWGLELAASDRMLAIRTLVVAAQRGFDLIASRSAKELADVGFFGEEGDEIWDGAAVQVQLSRLASWLEDPQGTLPKIEEAYDRTRQLVVWCEDLMPSTKDSFFWYLDLGQLGCAAVLNKDSLQNVGEEDYYEWPPPVCIARGLVVAVRGLLGYETSIEKNVAMLFG